MTLRRALYRWMWIACLALPAWTLLGWTLFSRGGWALAGVLLALPLLFIALSGVAGVTALRPGVRGERALESRDAVILLLWHASIVVFGTFQFDAGWTVTAMVLLGLVAFWNALWRLIVALRRKAAEFTAEYQQMRTPPSVTKPEPDWQGEMIVIDEDQPRRD
ncbi:hypothetical protein [Mycetocola reblochoni]|uniref:Uncharacterized protein n=2 Tax=Mycetocola reblochoni TaxID=331618 RepID=A0A1R4JCF9_9MICO|nr:hypothetical protein [Mycetocola reblochoni]RLP69991.1 hypothetical protein D9V30_04790 [Mycetocola reblochoni]SJN29485.1 hypothetical protein FM119_06615 [Mycetocola reblochoni REB411]